MNGEKIFFFFPLLLSMAKKREYEPPYEFSGISFDEIPPEDNRWKRSRNVWKPANKKVDFPNYRQLNSAMERNPANVLTDKRNSMYLPARFVDREPVNNKRWYVKLLKGQKAEFPEPGERLFFADGKQAVVEETYFIGERRATGWVELSFPNESKKN
jgi:hypothetical protein